MVFLFLPLFYHLLIIDLRANDKLYINCGNLLAINIPEKFKNEKLTYQATNARIIKGKKSTEVVIIPSSSQPVTISVTFKESVVFTQKFSTKIVPLPQVEVRQNNKVINPKYGIRLPLTTLTFVAKPDENFAATLPMDARYKCTKTSIKLIRSRKQADTFTCKESTANLSELKDKVLPEDMLEIEVEEVQRMTFEGKMEVIRIDKPVFKIPLHKN